MTDYNTNLNEVIVKMDADGSSNDDCDTMNIWKLHRLTFLCPFDRG